MSAVSHAADRSITLRVKNEQGRDENVKLYGASYALVIGASEYTAGWPKLPGVKDDVKDVKAALEAQGFSVTVVENPNQAALFKAFSDFIDKYGQEPENRLIFYYAGHGHTLKLAYGGDMGYIVPVDAPNPNRNKNGFLAKAVSMQQIEVYAKNAQAKHALFLFDSCFSGSIFALSRAVPENISYKTAQPVRQFITSGSAEEQVPDKSVFKQMFVAALKGDADVDKDGYVTGTELGEFLQSKVINYSKSSQHPQYGKIRDPNLDRGDFVFQMAKAGPVEKAARPAGLKNVPEPEPAVEEISSGGFSIDKIKKQAEAEKSRWDRNLQEMKTAYAQVEAFDADAAPDEMKVKVWQQFLDAFAQENPYASEDKELRAEAKKHVERWKTEKSRIEDAKKIGQPYTDPTTGMEFVFVKGGCYQMGDTFGDGDADEKPVHEVCVGDFYMGKYEVTQGQWRKVMGSNPSKFTGCGDNCPVEMVSWDDSQNFLGKLSEKGGKGYRLPSEAEWEYAARSGGKAEKYSGGNDIDSVAWYSSNSGSQTHPVGQKRPNGLGIYDMTGNVWEWTGDWYGENYYGSSPRDNPRGPSNEQYRALRGGSWSFEPRFARASDRGRSASSKRFDYGGLRAVFAPR
jgi:formylglycine-generating enzyme required for sulfatase activity